MVALAWLAVLPQELLLAAPADPGCKSLGEQEATRSTTRIVEPRIGVGLLWFVLLISTARRPNATECDQPGSNPEVELRQRNVSVTAGGAESLAE